jgi:Holliday junction resolvase
MVHTQRQRRGYNFETQLVKEFNKGNWKARRLGGASSGLPDVGIMNNSQSLLYAVEAKSTVYNNCIVPVKQIRRCIGYLDIHDIYKTKNTILAFRFASKRTKRNPNSLVKITRREPKYFFFIVKEFKRLKEIEAFTCNSKGQYGFKINNFDPEKEYNFDDYVDMERVTSIDQLKNYGWSQQSNFNHLFTV